MDGVTISYNILFEVNILHHYFLNRGQKNFAVMNEKEQAKVLLKYDVQDFLEISPSAKCQRLLERCRCLFKKTSTGIIVGTQAVSKKGNPKRDKPFCKIANDQVFTFHIYLKDFDLLNYTDLPLTGTADQVYLFSNLKGNGTKAFPSLSTFPDTYTSGQEYLPGDMLIDNPVNPAKLYIANLKTKTDPISSSDWLQENASNGYPMTYTSKKDRIPLVMKQMLYTVKTAGVEPEILVRTASGTAVEVRIDNLPDVPDTIQIDLGGLPEGLYSLHAQSSDHSYQDEIIFYLLQHSEPPFGILRLAAKSDASEYDLLDSQGYIRSPSYTLRFRNRATYWRYVGERFSASSVTAEPMPLTRFGVIDNVSVPDKNGTLVEDLPNPQLNMIKAEALSVQAEKKFYSEIHIH